MGQESNTANEQQHMNLLFSMRIVIFLAIQPMLTKEIKTPPDSWPLLLKESVAETGWQIALKNQELASFFPVRKTKALAEKEQVNNGLLPDSLEVGTLIGCMVFEQNANDFRGQTIPPGSYSLHFGLQPVSDDHAETSPTRNFAIFVPIEAKVFDPKPTQEKLFKQSGQLTGKHPVVMPLLPGIPTKSPKIARIQEEISVLEFTVPAVTPAGKAELPLRLAIAGKSPIAK